MALTWTSKPAGAVYRLTWTVPVIEGDSVSSAVLTVTNGNAAINSYEIDGNDVTAFVSGGTAGTTTTITASAVTNDGETLAETIYLPIRASGNVQGNTGLDLCAFALRKIAGIGNDPEGDELAAALEQLNDMLAEWAAQGADTGIPLPVLAGTTIVAPDGFIAAIKHNLLLRVYENYGEEVTQMHANRARSGMQLVKMALLPATRETAEFY